jgi:hypothetical protein
MQAWTPIEKFLTASLAAIGLLMFLFPLLVIQAPLVGEQEVTGYDIFSKVHQFSGRVDKSSEPKITGAPAPRVESSNAGPPLPLSLKIAWLIPVSVTAAFVLRVIVILGTRTRVMVSSAAAVIGTLCTGEAILHTVIANSDLHSWMQGSMKASSDELKNNPSAVMAEQFGNVMMSGFKIKPGFGLYTLAACLALATLIAKYRVLRRFRVVRLDVPS